MYLAFRMFWKQLHLSTSLLHPYVFFFNKRNSKHKILHPKRINQQWVIFYFCILFYIFRYLLLYTLIFLFKNVWMFGTYRLGFKHGYNFYLQRTLPMDKIAFLGISKWLLFHCDNLTEHCTHTHKNWTNQTKCRNKDPAHIHTQTYTQQYISKV